MATVLTPDLLMYDVMNSTHIISSLENDCSNRAIEICERHKLECPDVCNLFPAGRIVLGPLVEPNEQQFTAMTLDNICFVCFCGQLKHEDTLREKRWGTDELLCKELRNMDPSILAYISLPFLESEPNREWFNLVLFKDMNFLDVFEKSTAHQYARDYLSPESFTNVCVRRGYVRCTKLEGGEQRIFLDVTRTVHIRYYKEGEEEKFDRQVYLATESRNNSNMPG